MGYNNVGKFNFWNYSYDILENIGTPLLFMFATVIVYLIARILYAIKTNNDHYNYNIRYLAKVIIYQVYQFRLVNDIWISFMGLITLFVMLNYSGFSLTVSGIMSSLLGILCILSPIVTGYIVKKYQFNQFDTEKNIDNNLE